MGTTTTPKPDKTKLAAPLPEVTDAVEELLKVLTGGQYDSATYWGKATVDDANTYLNGLPVSNTLTDATGKLTGKVPALEQALGTGTNTLKEYFQKFTQQTTTATQDILAPLNALNTPHPDQKYTEPAQIGLFPALFGIAGAAGVDAAAAQNGVNQALDMANNAVNYVYFGTLGVGALAKLGTALSGKK
jgi:hypothetical protein